MISVGPDYQATIPDLLAEDTVNGEADDEDDKLLWNPHDVDVEKSSACCSAIKKIIHLNTSSNLTIHRS